MTQHGDQPAAAALFEAANKLRGSVESAEYKHLVLGLVFLKYVSDSFDRRRQQLDALAMDPASDYYVESDDERQEILEDRDEYTAENVFWVPADARWAALLAKASQPDIGVTLDRALDEIERENEDLRGVLPKVYARAALSPEKLGDLVSTIAKIGFGDDPDKARDVLGRVYEYFIKEFARSEGHRGGEFYTPASVVNLLVEMLQPYKGRICDPACGSCGMFIQSAKFISAHAGRPEELAIYGQEMNQATWRIGKMNLAIHGLAGEIKLGNSLLDDQHQALKADFVIANPPFNQKLWGAEQVKADSRWKHGLPPDSNANYAWIQHFASHLSPVGRAGFVMANGAAASTSGGDHLIRKSMLKDDIIDCLVALPGALFYTTGIPVCLWLLDRDRQGQSSRPRQERVLFIDARAMGRPISKTQIELSSSEIERVGAKVHDWRDHNVDIATLDEPGLSRVADVAEIEANAWSMAPARYVKALEEVVDPHEERARVAAILNAARHTLGEVAAVEAKLHDLVGFGESDV
jgi:type I restriction enzyme M protein